MGILRGLYFGITLSLLLDLGFSSEYDALTLLEKYAYNRFLYANIPRPFETINPKQIRRNRFVGISTKEHQIKHHGTHEHYKKVTFQLNINNRPHKLRLTRNEALLSHGIKVKHFLEENKQIITETVEHCYYHGYVRKDPWSSVAVSTCNGIRGVIHFHNQTYIIHPLVGGDEGTEHPHVIYKATASHTETCGNNKGQWIPFHELHKGEFIRKVKLMKAQQGSQQTDKKDKEMKLALVLDNSMFYKLNLSSEDIVQYIIQTANMLDLYYKELNIRTPLVYIEYWNSENKIDVGPNLRKLLQRFLQYKTEHLIGVDHHSAHLITGTDLEDNSVGMAIPDSICTDRAISISKSPNILEPQQLATILSHMIGHNLGIKHDEDGPCTCQDEFGCIMSVDVLERTGLHSRMFSSCSLSDLDVALSIDVASCLKKDNTQLSFKQTCGNMHVEPGEECDCGPSEKECEVIDPCCDAKTCLLKSWTQCRTGACCHNCTFMTNEHVCRERSTDCDVPEYCTGTGGECPENNYIADGHPCLNDTGYCLGGLCSTLDLQCQHIWGKEAYGADMQCFEKFNPTGNFNGHCGKDDRTGSFAKCLPEDVQCGLLHCEGGSTNPLYGSAGSDRAYSETLMSINGVKYGCKVIHGPALMELPNHGLVQEGTKCGEGKFCMRKQCVPASTALLTCPGTDNNVICSGHGVCTKFGTCFCDKGWSGIDCTTKVIIKITTKAMTTVAKTTTSTVLTTTSTANEIRVVPIEPVDMTTKPNTNTPIAAVVKADDNGLSSLWLIIILVSVVGGVVLMLTLTFLCYRRKSPVKFSRGKKDLFGFKKKKKGDNSTESGKIKFGSMPSYKNQKGLGKKKKGKKGRNTSEEESDIGELPPPPVIICDPDSARPERGILKNGVKLIDERRSSESNTGGSDVNFDQESVERYAYDEDDEDDDEAEEIQEILSRKFEPEQSVEALDQFADNASFDFMLPTPNFSSICSNRSPSPTQRLLGYGMDMNTNSPQRPLLWKSNPSSPPKRKIIRMKNIDELIQHLDRQTIDLSPSPDELPMQISPSTSEDIRSSSTEDRHHNSHTPQSPLSITSGSTRDTFRPFLGSQWTKYILKRNELENGMGLGLDDAESPFTQINIPPPMSPLNIRNIFNYAQTTLGRDSNDTPLGSQTGECSSTNGTANSRGFDKSSGYGSEHDPERFSVEDMSRNQSRSGSTSPPSYSAVIRTGPNQIKLVPAKKLHETGIDDYDLHKLLQGLPRIDAGTFERSPLHRNERRTDEYNYESMPPGNLPNPCPLSEQNADNCGSTPCIDRSLEEIPGALEKSKSKKRNSMTKQKRPLSLGVQKEQSPDKHSDDIENKRYSALDDMSSSIQEVVT